MILDPSSPPGGAPAPDTANEAFKRSFGHRFWGSMIVATVLHFALFALFPELTAEDFSSSAEEIETIDLPPELDIPPPPEALTRPATPIVTDAPIDDDITIGDVDFDSNPVHELEPPGEEGRDSVISGPVLTPHTVAPEMTNRAEMERALEREYPPLLRDAGIGGTVNVWIFINEQGQVEQTRVNRTSGHRQLDQAALEVARIMEFTPALNRDKVVPVWVSVAVQFESR